jgi:hypothetical protein
MRKSIALTLLNARGHTGGTLALKFKVSRSLVYQSINGRGSRKIRVAIAIILGKMPSFIWSSSPVVITVLDDYFYIESLKKSS